jgi:hypothetical protein
VKRFVLLVVFILIALTVLSFLFFPGPTGTDFRFKAAVMSRYLFASKNRVVTGRDGWLFYTPELAYVLRSIPKSNFEHILGFDAAMRRLGTTLVVVPVPNKIDVYADRLTRVKPPFPVKKSRADLIDRLRKAGVCVVDLVPEYKRIRDSRPMFDPFQTHWTSDGIDVAARTVASAIDSIMAAKGIVRTTQYQVRDSEVMTFGDLRNRLCKNPKNSPVYAALVHRVYCADSTPYHDEKASRILVLGDSFTDHFRWWNAHFSAQLSRYIDTPVRTWCSLLANTDGPCMYDRRPGAFPHNGVVIWVFTSRVLRHELCREYRATQGQNTPAARRGE